MRETMDNPTSDEPTLVSGSREAASMARGVFLVVALALFVSGCSFLRPEPDRSRYFVLASRDAGSAAASPDPRGDVYLGLGPVSLPGYLDTQALVRSSDGGSIEYIPDAYWAEALEEGFARALLFRTSSRIGTPHAVAFPWYSTTRVDWKVPVDVLRFEATSEGRVLLVARWRVIRTKDQQVVASGETVVEESAGDDPVLVVAALNASIDRLAEKIAAAVLNAAPPESPEAGPKSERKAEPAPQPESGPQAGDDSAPPSR